MVDDRVYVTQDGLERMKQELHELKMVRRREIADKIERAKELGDLSENAEYSEAKEEQAFIEGRIIELETMLNQATVVAAPAAGAHQVGIGVTVRLRHNGSERTFSIVGASEADPANGKISHESPIGRALIGRSVGDEVEVETPKGQKTYVVLEIA